MTAPAPPVLLSALADEVSNEKTAVEQLAVCAALGLRYYSIRFIDLGSGVKNVMKLTKEERQRLIRELHPRFDMQVASIASPLGKVKLVDKDDGTQINFVPFEKYLSEDVRHAIELAHEFDTKLIRGFSFYPPRGEDPGKHFAQAADQIGRITDLCQKEGVIYGLEIEANLIGSSGEAMARLHREINNPALVTIFDGANLSAQNIPAAGCFENYVAMKPGLGWIHIKDYRIDPSLTWHGHVDEERLKNFVPADEGDSGHEAILRDFKTILPEVDAKMKKLGVPGVFVDLEPHLRGGGVFGGYSGADGLGVALRALCNVLDYVGIDYELRDFAGMKRLSR